MNISFDLFTMTKKKQSFPDHWNPLELANTKYANVQITKSFSFKKELILFSLLAVLQILPFLAADS